MRRTPSGRMRPPRSAVFEALAAHAAAVRPSDRAVRGSAERVPAGRRRRPATRRGTRCSITAGDRRIRLGGSCCASSAYDSDASLDRQSDAVCTALQLTNFWQDLAIDWRRGRLYRAARRSGAPPAQPADLDARPLSRRPGRRRSHERHARTRLLFEEGRPVVRRCRGRLRYELRATWLGGTRILDRLGACGFDVFNHRPALERSTR